MTGLNMSSLICFKKLPDDWGNSYYDSLLMERLGECYRVRYYHTESFLLSTGITFGSLQEASDGFETILRLGNQE